MTERLTNALNYLTDELRRSRRGNIDDYPGSDDDDLPDDGTEADTEHSGAMECVDYDGVCDTHDDYDDGYDSDGYDDGGGCDCGGYDSHDD